MPTDVYIWILYVSFGTAGADIFISTWASALLVLTVMDNDEGFGPQGQITSLPTLFISCRNLIRTYRSHSAVRGLFHSNAATSVI